VFHRIPVTDRVQGPALYKLATKGVSSPKVFVIDDQSPYGVGLVDYMKIGGATLAGQDSVPDKTTDWSASIAKVKTAGANVVIFTGYYAQAATLYRQLRDSGYTGILAGGDGVLSPGILTLASASILEGVRLTAADVPFENLLTKDELASFTKITGVKVPGLYSTTAYNAARVFLTCIEQGKLTRSAIQLCVNSTTFKGAGGSSIKFNRYGDIVGGADVGGYLVKDGKIKYDGLA
jgi:branched-chain amino acid transport system substrate-binding protein